MTTIGLVNKTGILTAVKDGRTHVSIFPVGTALAGWRLEGVNSKWTITLKSIVIKS